MILPQGHTIIIPTICSSLNRDLVIIAQWLQPIMMYMPPPPALNFCNNLNMHMLQGLSTASRLLEGTESKLVISPSVQSILTLLESSDFALGKGIALMFARAIKSSVHAQNTEIYRVGDPCNQVYFVVAGKVAKMVTEGSRNARVQVTAAAEAYGLADVVEADACLGIDALYAGDTLHSRSAVAVTPCIVASVARRYHSVSYCNRVHFLLTPPDYSDFEDIERVISRYIAEQLALFLKQHVPAFKTWKKPALEGCMRRVLAFACLGDA